MTYKRLTASIAGIVLLIGQFGPVIAQSIPTAPTAPIAPSDAPSAPPPPTAPSEPTPPPPPPTAPTLPSPTVAPTPLPQSHPTETSTQIPTSGSTPIASSTEPTTSAPTTTQSAESGNVGETSLSTGDATTQATAITTGNANSSTAPKVNAPSASVINADNGSGSANAGSVSLISSSTTNQTNSASLTTIMDQSAGTGKNSTNSNVGTTSIESGNANVSGTIVHSVNTNIDNVALAEFNIVDDHIGDYVLDFGTYCITGCHLLTNSGNGADSTNTAVLDSQTSAATFMHNEAALDSTMILAADTGNNSASKNTGGDTTISTGDANVSATLINFANSNLSGGEIIYGEVNIYGNLIGDLVFPEIKAGGSATLATSSNGSDSSTSTDFTTNQNTTIDQENTAEIRNTIYVEGTSGNNEAANNTGGDTQIHTGEVNVDVSVLNLANTNIIGDMWLVLVNHAGKWVGKIMGAEAGATLAGSLGLEFEVDEQGEIRVVNKENGAGSENGARVNQNSETTIEQVNSAAIENTLHLSGNTGGNTASKNTGGNTTIDTGDVNILATVVNFVNTNIMGGGRLFVTVVNVFGSWLGNFRGPGVEAEETEVADQGAPQEQLPVEVLDPQMSQENSSASQERLASHQGTSSNSTTSSDPDLAKSLEAPDAIGRVLGVRTDQTPPDLTTQNLADVGAVSIPTLAKTVKDTLEINLAYLVLLAPPAAIYFILRRRRLGQE